MIDIGKTIRRAFKSSGMNILALSKLADIPYSAAHGLMTGNRNAKMETLNKVCGALGLELKPKRKG